MTEQEIFEICSHLENGAKELSMLYSKRELLEMFDATHGNFGLSNNYRNQTKLQIAYLIVEAYRNNVRTLDLIKNLY